MPFGTSLNTIKRGARSQKSSRDVNAWKLCSLKSCASTEPQPLSHWQNSLHPYDVISQENSTLRSRRVPEGLRRRICARCGIRRVRPSSRDLNFGCWFVSALWVLCSQPGFELVSSCKRIHVPKEVPSTTSPRWGLDRVIKTGITMKSSRQMK